MQPNTETFPPTWPPQASSQGRIGLSLGRAGELAAAGARIYWLPVFTRFRRLGVEVIEHVSRGCASPGNPVVQLPTYLAKPARPDERKGHP